MNARNQNRTESIIVTVASGAENATIQRMQLFGWILAGHQSVTEITGSEIRPDPFYKGRHIIDQDSHTYEKLHFTRDLGLPNLNRIKELERAYSSKPYQYPVRSLWGPIIFTIIPFPGTVMVVVGAVSELVSLFKSLFKRTLVEKDFEHLQELLTPMIGCTIMVAWVILGVVWIRTRYEERKKEIPRRQLQETENSRIKAAIIAEAQSLLA